MHQDAFPGEDISDRPPPEDSVPAILALVDGEQPSGRYRRQRGGGGMSALATVPTVDLDHFVLPASWRPPSRPSSTPAVVTPCG